MNIVSLQVGQPQTYTHDGKTWQSGIGKQPVSGTVWLTRENITGDGQADRKHHGGPDKAVCAYPAEHYDYWQPHLGLEMPFGAFGENLTTSGLLESKACIGDTYQLGEALVQISQPRQPCWKPARKWGVKTLTAEMIETGYTGWYFRVLREGHIQAGDALTLQERPHSEWTIEQANQVMHHRKADRQAAAALAACPALSASWVRSLTRRL